MKLSLRTILLLIFGTAVAGTLGYALMPQPIPVDFDEVDRGELLVTVDEDGKTRITDRYIVSAPIAGRLERITLDEGDAVVAGETVLARIVPSRPDLLNARERAEAEARIQAAEAAVDQAETRCQAAQVALDLATSQLDRARTVAQSRAISAEELEEQEATYRLRSEDLRSARFGRQVAVFELSMAKAALLQGTERSEAGGEPSRLEIVAPVEGVVLDVFQESETIVDPAASLLEIGDPRNLEIEIDVLSTDAVRIRPGARVLIEHWGGEQTLEARVRLVEPAAYTKLSALGVEEQRVDVIADFLNPREDLQSLGDGFRVEARIVTWEAADVLRVPTSALFRDGEDWAVFIERQGKAVRTLIEIEQRNERFARVKQGLQPGDRVVAYPSDRIRDGVAIERRTMD